MPQLSPRDLVLRSQRELARRATAADNLDVGSFVVIKDASVAKAFDETIGVVSESGSSGVQITSISNRSSSRTLQRSQVARCLALGDHVEWEGSIATVGPVVYASGATVHLLADKWGAADVGITYAECGALERKPTTARTPVSRLESTSPRVSDASESQTYFVRCRIGSAFSLYTNHEIGPGTSAEDFCSVAATSDPCIVRADTIVDTPRGKAVICDFLGGATLWVWVCLLTPATSDATRPWWNLSPSYKHRPLTSEISLHPEIEPTKEPQPMNAAPTPTKIDQLCTPEPARNSNYLLDERYHDRLRDAVSEIRGQWRGGDLSLIEDEIDRLTDETDVCVGLYTIRATQRIVLPDDRIFYVAKCSQVGASDQNLYYTLAVGLLTPMSGGQLAQLEQGAQSSGGLMARTAKGLTSGATDIARKGFAAAKNHVRDEITRTALATYDVATEQSILGAQQATSRTMLGMLGGLLGKDPSAMADNPVMKHIADKASVGLLRLAGAALSGSMPTVSSALNTSAGTLERGLDRKHAEQVMDVVTPLALGAARLVAAPVIQRMMPALAPAPVAPTPALEPAQEDRPPTKRTRKPKAAPVAEASEPAADPTPRKRSRKAAKDGGAE